MGGSWIEEKFEEYKMQLITRQQCLSVWEMIELVGKGHFSKGMDRQTLSMGITEVFQELILDMLKQVKVVCLRNNNTVHCVYTRPWMNDKNQMWHK